MSSRRERLNYALISLDEFAAGDRLLRAHQGTPGTPAGSTKRFLMNALYQYTANYYLVGGDYTLLPLLRECGLEFCCSALESVLARPLDDSTVGEVLTHLRNKAIVHTPFKLDCLDEPLLAKFDMRKPEKARVFFEHLRDLWQGTVELREPIRAALEGRLAATLDE